MCEGSIYVPHREATKKERLVVRRIPNMGLKGYYTFRAAERMLVCVKGTQTQAIMKEVRLHIASPETREAWDGKQDVSVTLVHAHFRDYVVFPDGSQVLLVHVKDGVRIDIGIPVVVREPKGMKVIEGAITEAMALPPEPKPEDGEEKPTEPSAPVEPEKEPAEGDD